MHSQRRLSYIRQNSINYCEKCDNALAIDKGKQTFLGNIDRNKQFMNKIDNKRQNVLLEPLK